MVRMLVLVRHGDAERYGPEGTDASRRLTRRGAKALRRAYPRTFRRLADAGDVALWVSPATRALQTAEVAADVLGIDPKDFDIHQSLYDQDDEEFLAELGAEGDGCVVAVGHVPFMNRVLRELTGEGVAFAKGSVAAISFASGDLSRGRLEWFADCPDA